MTDVTQLLSAIEHGDPQAARELLPLVYDELRKPAAQKLSREEPGQTLQATALVHDAYLRLVVAEKEQHWDSRRHFFAAAAEAMRRIFVENARRKKRLKYGEGRQRVELADQHLQMLPIDDELLELDEALTRLAAEDADAAELVKLHFFAGLSRDETAATLGISRVTAYRNWSYARTWLRCALEARIEPAS
jgi:RNA polymerase sigma factor (TIGR02999 family)